MRLAFAMLADFAEATPDGKVTIGGGDFDTIYAPAFPAVHPRTVALVMKYIADAADLGMPHVLRIEFVGPNGQLVAPPFDVQFTPQPHQLPINVPTKLAFVFNFQALLLPAPGTYHFRVFLDEAAEPIASLPLYALEQPQPPARGQDEIQREEGTP
jgi:hypothetical protein